MPEFIVQILHKSNKERDGKWYDLDRVLKVDEADTRARKFADAYGRPSRIVELLPLKVVEPSPLEAA